MSHNSPIVRMNRLLLTTLFWISLTAVLSAQTRQPRTPPPLELTAEIISQSYCAVNQDTVALELKLKLRYRNISKQKVILYKGHDLFYQTKIRSAAGNPSGPYEVWVVNSRYFDEEVEPIDQASPGKVFVTLSPGRVDTREIMIGIDVVSEKVPQGDSSIRKGDHTLQLIASTWYQSRALAQKLRLEWLQKGLLWADPLDSKPISFRVQRPSLIAPCK
jgi:hypothetical protein